MEAGWIKEQKLLWIKNIVVTNDQAKLFKGEVTKESMDRADVIFKQIKATEKEMEDKIGRAWKLTLSTMAITSNLMAAAEKDSSDKKPETCQEALRIPLKG